MKPNRIQKSDKKAGGQAGHQGLELLAQGSFQKSADAVIYLKKNPQVVQNLTRYKTKMA